MNEKKGSLQWRRVRHALMKDVCERPRKMEKTMSTNSLVVALTAMLFSMCANAGDGWVMVPNDKMVEIGRIVGTALGARAPGQLSIAIKDTVAWPFSSGPTTTYPNHSSGNYYITGAMNEDDANKQILSVLIGAYVSGKSLSLYIREDDGNSQYAGRAHIVYAGIAN